MLVSVLTEQISKAAAAVHAGGETVLSEETVLKVRGVCVCVCVRLPLCVCVYVVCVRVLVVLSVCCARV